MYYTMIQASKNNLLEISQLLNRIEGEHLREKLPVLSGSSIGQHIRHILEFYICLLERDSRQSVCYDKRERKLLLEESIPFIQESIQNIISMIDDLSGDQKVMVEMSFSEDKDLFTTFESSLYRELAYCLEHNIHHLTIIKIGLLNQIPDFEFSPNFGVAYSTIRNEKKCVQ